MPNEGAEKFCKPATPLTRKSSMKECYSKLKQPQSEYSFSQTLGQTDASSFGILSINSNADQTSQLEGSSTKQKRLSEMSAQLLRERQLAQMTMQKTIEKPTFVRSESKSCQRHTDSTVSERDFLGCLSFTPGQMSTPRASTEDSSDEVRSITETTRRMSEAYDVLLHKMRTSDISIPEICQEMKVRIGHPNESFIPAELAKDKLLADELSWRREKDIPGRNNEIFLQISEPSFDKFSVSDFFQQRSDDISDLIPNKSPSKTHLPVPLIEDAPSFAAADNSVQSSKKSLSVSGIAKMLAEMDTNDSPNGIISLLCKQDKGKLNSENKENAYVSNANYSMGHKTRTPSSREPRHKSLSPMGSVMSDESQRAATPLVEKSLTSLRSGSSLSNLPDGKLPIEATKTELSWSCTKLGKTAVKVCIMDS